MKSFELTIDGQQVTAESGETILEVVRRLGWSDRIPTLCYEPALPPYTSCFVCVVEQEGVGKLLPACSSPAAPGSVIHTGSEQVVAARKVALELMMSNHPADCVAPCSREGGCPAGIDIQTYLWQAEAGQYQDAVKTIRARNPFPIVCGRVCVRRCEDVCRRGILDNPVGINMVKRMVADHWPEEVYAESAGPESGKSVAIVGGGPAGLTAAYYLRLAGHDVTVYEMRDKLGGMLRWGIPDYRLPQDRLDWEIQQILDLGVTVKYGVTIGTDITLDELREKFDSVFLAIGAQVASAARIKGEDHPTVLSGLDFLIGIKEGKADEYAIAGKKVAVVGGGNTAIDAARTAMRLGAEHVTIVYRRTRQEMPANVEEIEAADEEGVRLEFLIAPVAVQTDGDRLEGLLCQKMRLGEPDASGRRRPIPVPDSEHLVACDCVVGAIGQKVDIGGIRCADQDLAMSRWGTPEADKYSMATSVPGVFTGGDAWTGPAVAIDAIAHGRKVALSICQYLQTGEAARIYDKFSAAREHFSELKAADLPPTEATPRHHNPMLDPAEAIKTFDESELTLDDHHAEDEARRCLSCGCASRHDCELRELSEQYGLSSDISGQTTRVRVDRSHPQIVLDPNKCILCTRCIRTCSDVLGVAALGLVERGFDTYMAPTLGRPLVETECVSCGNCVEACPTGALAFVSLAQTAAKRTVASSNCVLCPELCSVAVGTNEFGFSINNQKENGGSSVPICVVGRYDNVKQLGGKRITQPMVRQKGGLVPVSMDEAVQVATAAFKRATDAGASVVVSGGGTLSIEEGQLLATLGRDGLHASVGSLESAGAESGLASCAVGQLKNTASDDALEKAEWIIWTGTCPDRDDTVLMARIRRLMRGGAQVLAISSAACEITHNATHWIDVRRGSEAEFLASLVTDDTDSINALAAACHVDVARLESVKAMLQGQGPVVGILADPTDPDVGTLYAALGGLVSALRSSCDKSGVLVMRSITNGSGLEQAGLLAQQGQRPDDIQHAASATPLAGVWLVRDQSPEALKAARRAAFLVVQDVVECDLLERADVVLPASTQFETGGTYVAWDGRSVVIAPALPPVGPSTLDVLSAAAKALK